MLVLPVVLALTASACGRQKVTTRGEDEGVYLDVGPLSYQVQISRQLNPKDSEDRAYLQGVEPALAHLKPDEVWFAIFVRAQNTSDRAAPAASDFEITDTVDHRYRPVPIGSTNPFAYRVRPIAPGQLLPSSASAAGTDPVGQGALLLFKLPLATLANRPLEFHIVGPTLPLKEAVVSLDV